MINKNEHNYIVDTLIKRIEQLEEEMAAKNKIMDMLVDSNERKQKHLNKIRSEYELLKLDYEVLVDENKILKELLKEER